ncbi:hypothetical protein SNE40_013297 [Patella caerulea]|uniref:Hexosyltransferase n=1 Tax=Patella caerulea TaxID=87958 RepID=A0AAN8JJ20_PATCE
MLWTDDLCHERWTSKRLRVYPSDSVKIIFVILVFVYLIYLVICPLIDTSIGSHLREYKSGGSYSKAYGFRDVPIKTNRNNPWTVYIYRDYLLNNPSICKDVKYLFTLIVVNSVPGNFKQRERMRSTIGNRTILPTPIRIVFLLGSVLNGSLQNRINAEHNIYGDTIQADILDTNEHLTLKSVLGLKWITEYCKNTEFVIWLNDDMTADIFYLLIKFLPSYIGTTKTVFCIVQPSEKIGNIANPWFISDTRFKYKAGYLFLNCVGPVAIISSDIIPVLYNDLAHFPKGAENVKFYDIKDAVGQNVYNQDHECFNKRNDPCLFISGPAGTLLKYWEYVYEKRYDYLSDAVDNLDVFEGF